MNKLICAVFAILTISMANSCNQDNGTEQVLLPTNLNISVEQIGNGQVRVNFSADRTNFFRVSFGVGNAEPELVSGSSATYRYTAVGEYVVTVQAHATESAFIKQEETVVITNQILGIGLPSGGFESPMSYDGYALVWNDEFEGSSLSSDWVFETGDGCPNLCGWGNNELQFYRRENTEVKDGFLVITAKQESVGGKNYTSSRIKTQGRQNFEFGRIDIRAAMPQGQGIWPALWMLGESITDISWPACGEIDIMEMVGGNASGRDDTVHGTLHWDNNGTYNYRGGKKTLPAGAKLADNFHVYSIIWDESKITWLLDDVVYHEDNISPASMDEFRAPFFFIINLAIGGNWPGSPDSSTIFPQQLAVDYVRVFQKD
ncbi:glycoside hydrolase family 16 protein [Belliella sp. DSM 111904]|uniref:Glycoside hydrolase family 16 protein n=1 Tax=Belliella filtrata TaxID=2923435 RepID=A0ABS9V0E8_9BACT|nr:glycoside hydrolase family 16 protein [Belliella filtrata]MCH7409878.1 glycoside hydrolase family 16 protein [Belliella filtrata]